MTVIGVAANDTESAMQSFVDRFGVGGFPHINDANGEIWVRYGVSYQPAYAFISADGTTETTAWIPDSEVRDKIASLFG